jgi:hypothetical protein
MHESVSVTGNLGLDTIAPYADSARNRDFDRFKGHDFQAELG